MSRSEEEALKTLLDDALGKSTPIVPPPGEHSMSDYSAIRSSSQTSECDDNVACSSGGRSMWVLAGLAVVAMVAVALAWRDLKRHCASDEDMLWGCFRVPPKIRLLIVPGQPAPSRQEIGDPYFTLIDN